VGVNDPGGRLQVGQNVTFADLTRLIADFIHLNDGVNAYDVLANILLAPRAIIRNITVVPLPAGTLPLTNPFCPIDPITCGGENIRVLTGQSRTLAPGTYGDFVAMDGAQVTLAGPGTFTFCSFRGAHRARILVDGAGQSTINVRDNFRISNGGFFGPVVANNLPNLNVGGSLFRVATNARIEAFVRAPNARANGGRGSHFVGTFCFDTFGSDKRITIECPIPCPPASTSGAFLSEPLS
jgi:hypothetical protein